MARDTIPSPRGNPPPRRFLPILAAVCVCLATGSTAAQSLDPDTKVPYIQYVLDGVKVDGNEKTSIGLIEALVGLAPGDPFGLLDLEVIKRRLMATGYFLDVTPRLEKSAERGHVLLILEVEERNTILLSDIFIGVSDERGVWGGLDIVEGNLFGRGLTLGGAFVVNQDQLSTRLSLADPHAFSLPLRLGGSAHFADGHESIFVSDPEDLPGNRLEPLELNFDKTGGELNGGFYPLSLLGVFVDLGFEVINGNSALADRTETYLKEGRSLHGIIRMTLDHDTRDSTFVPTSGYRLNLSIQGSSSVWGSDYDYVKMVLRSAYYLSLGLNDAGHVLRFDLFGGMILGEPPFFERFYVGDVSAVVPSRDLGLNYSTTGTPDFLGRGAGNLGYEKVVAGGGVEYGVPLAEGPAPFYRVEFFMGAGIFGMTTPGDLPGLREVNLGVDLLRERQTSVFPIDLTFNVGFKAETPIGVFGLSFANALALVPF